VAGQLDTVHHRHADVGDHQVSRLGLEQGKGLNTVGRHPDDTGGLPIARSPSRSRKRSRAGASSSTTSTARAGREHSHHSSLTPEGQANAHPVGITRLLGVEGRLQVVEQHQAFADVIDGHAVAGMMALGIEHRIGDFDDYFRPAPGNQEIDTLPGPAPGSMP
jgi:hypothetical protein